MASAVVSPDAERVVYTGDLTVSGRDDLYAAQLHEIGTQLRLSESPNDASDVAPDVHVAPDGFVVYRADRVVDEQQELWSTSNGLRPAPPSDVEATAVTTTTATMTWAASAGPRITAYEVRATSEDGHVVTATVDGDVTTSELTDLRPDTAYDVEVRARNAVGTSTPATTPITTSPEADGTCRSTVSRVRTGTPRRPASLSSGSPRATSTPSSS